MKVRQRDYELPFFGFDLFEVNRDAAKLVGHGGGVDVVVADRSTLAGISSVRRRIELHPIFNIEWLPVEVMRCVLIHEHIHLVIPPREVEAGVVKSHPPEFWDLERALNPLAGVAWNWMCLEWGDSLRSDEKRECVWVKRGWRKRQRERQAFRERLCSGTGMSPADLFPTWDDALGRFRTDPAEGQIL